MPSNTSLEDPRSRSQIVILKLACQVHNLAVDGPTPNRQRSTVTFVSLGYPHRVQEVSTEVQFIA